MPFSENFAEYILSTSDKTLTKEASVDTEYTDRVSFYKQAAEAMNTTIHTIASAPKSPYVAPSLMMSDAFIANDMSKVAGLALHRTEPEDIELFLKEYMYNELSFFPDKLNITVDIKPQDTAPAGGNSQIDMQIINATGTVNIEYYGAMIQLPFIMQDKEILPFDTIQLGTERAVYTRENMRNILFNIKRKNETLPTTSTPYASNVPGDAQSFLSADKFKSPLTDNGFMSDMLHIQSVIGKGQTLGNRGVYASIEALLEKTAELNVRTINDTEELLALKKAYLPKAEKVANAEFADDTDMAIKKQAAFDDLEKQEFADVQILNDGQKFTFTEKNGRTLDNVNAEIRTIILGVNGPSNKRLVITSDGRFKLLGPGERFVYNLGVSGELLEPVQFERKYTNIEGVNPGYKYTASVNGAYLVPFTVTKVISGPEYGLKVSKIVYCLDVNNNEFVLLPLSNVADNEIVFKSKDSILSEIEKIEDPHVFTKYNMFLKRTVPTLCISGNTSFVALESGQINNMLTSKEMMFEFDGNMKMASLTDRVTIVAANESKDKFDVYIEFINKKFGSSQRTVFTNINETKTLGILRRIGFDYNKASAAVMQAKRENMSVLDILPTHTPWMVKADVTAGMAATRVLNTTKNSLFSGDTARKLLAGVLSGVFASNSDTNSDDSLLSLKRFAAESAGLANNLEKAAMKYESETFQKLAALMVIDNRLNNAFIDAMEGKYVTNMEVFAGLKEAVPVMEKLAYDLVELKLAQFINKNDVVSPNVINGALRHMNSLTKCATMFGEDYDNTVAAIDADAKAAQEEAEKKKEELKKSRGILG